MTMYVYISLVVYPLVPFALIICLNCAILVTLWHRKHSGLAHSSTIDKVESQLTRMIVVVCVAYLILMCPFEVHGVYMYYARYQKIPEIVSKYFFTTYLFYLLGLLNSGINCLLYFVQVVILESISKFFLKCVAEGTTLIKSADMEYTINWIH